MTSRVLRLKTVSTSTLAVIKWKGSRHGETVTAGKHCVGQHVGHDRVANPHHDTASEAIQATPRQKSQTQAYPLRVYSETFVLTKASVKKVR